MNEKVGNIFRRTIFFENPVIVQILGICSTLAVTNKLLNTLIMCIGLTMTTSLSSLSVSLMRRMIPRKVRMIVEVFSIAFYVIIFDLFLKAYLPEISVALGPYVGLIITNCIVMGRTEAYALANSPMMSFLDGLGSGLGYSLILLIVATIREILGFGSLFGFRIFGENFVNWTIMVMPASAFFVLAVILWIFKAMMIKKR
ncbi:NADH:ubiquinone oxidoreductase [Pseudothermotoga hypogea DSM 11164 = NBRC 106472]|uniref:NADH:ubiquinone oxidoreductase n=1 Tax=Pseudothermotoga hypogea DSM 11164 = NBRC 106472 TaxID=1123384 RepID=A0A0X1KQN1_9THEM|nr:MULTISPECIES: Rnf-Nqr domain containing protein [Pseudothermotoga]AJC73563.1 NADH:ubiquinone oxidoreductase [Pseudothermotoga hypogea DSM 11164 = NBRC 106472]MBC7123183.1 NADH:ubiquinone reductase (Na(+)-transporting) subunit D [Pseudothermotoga sp.]MDI6862237.1 Rnf-Nqr domain containing protein [Pseudothermotoga sp.]